MCGRYSLSQPENLRTRFKTENSFTDFEPSHNIAPSQYLPTITRNSPNKITMMKWGFVPEWGKDKKLSLINLRSETATSKPYFKKILLTNRCLVPADGFYEWKKVQLEDKVEKIPYFIHLKNSSLFSFAGVYNTLTDAEGKGINTFAILTTAPNALIKKIHNRMPVILKKDHEDSWLSGQTKISEIENALKSYPEDEMEAYKISTRVNNPVNDDAGLIKKLN